MPDTTSFDHFSAGEPAPAQRGKVDNLGLDYYLSGETLQALIPSAVTRDLAAVISGAAVVTAEIGKVVTFSAAIAGTSALVAGVTTGVALASTPAGQTTVVAEFRRDLALNSSVFGTGAVAGEFVTSGGGGPTVPSDAPETAAYVASDIF